LIYPERLPASKWLAFVTEQLDSIEVNTSFYRIPKPESIQNWQKQAPERVRFALKLWRGITHYKKLRNATPYVQSFLDVAENLAPERRAPLLIQLPPNQGKDVEKLESFIGEMQVLMATEWNIAVEFRNAAWMTDDVYSALDRLGVAICLHDMSGRAPADRPNEAPFVYIRRHGSGEGRYQGSYSAEQLREDAARMQAWARAGKNVYIYYNNDIGGHAYHNAIDLKRLIAKELLPA
jgi:uncharacterized protein YecE (DUF72 family)